MPDQELTLQGRCRILFSPLRIFRLMALVFMLVAVQAQAQDTPPARRGSRIVDDTTKQIYGPNTSRYFYEQDVFYNREVLHPIDTFIRNFHRWNYVQRFNNLYQDLGNVGTAIQPIFYRAPDIIGARTGATVYDLYWETEPVRYYDTKSPYSNMRVILGGKGRSLTRATFSRNINANWNFGFTYRGLFIDKQIQRTGKGDRITRGNYYDAYTAYQTKDSTYRLFFNFRRNFHRVEEFGGVNPTILPEFDLTDYADPDAQPWLTTVESNDLRKNTHLFHQYKVGRALQVYHVADWYRQSNKFLDVNRDQANEFYDFNHIVTDSVNDVTNFKSGRHEVGIKGNISKIFYNGYYAIRNYDMQYNTLLPLTRTGYRVDTLAHLNYDSLHIPVKGTESYLGGRISLMLDSIGQVNGWAEVMDHGNYRIQGEIKSKWFEARFRQMRYAPGFVQQVYRGVHDKWNNNFYDTESTWINGYLRYKSSVIDISPGLSFTRQRNYVFFKKVTDNDTLQQVLPVQSSGNQIWASPEVRLSLTFFRHITWSTQVIYTEMLDNADDAIQVPEIMANIQLSYANIFFNDNFDFHTGVDVHWRSAYYPNGYDPAIRQFYVQTTEKSEFYPIVDIFLNAKIKRGRIFFKYHNLLQAFTKTAYLITPGYPGQANIFDFGFDWSFYD